MSAKLMEYFNKQPRLGTLSTSSKDGKVDAALFGSPHMIDEKTVVMATAKNRTFSNLQENPNAVFMIVEPGKGVFEWKGVRVYLKMKEYSTSGELLEMIRSQVAKFVGEEAANRMYASVTFEVSEVRPLIDFGQGWEKSI
ncbi:MAG TPA: pyridoxamine 5'-phosphate oxidase family protein [Methanotrichaceae archaeon]|nr:pyridoxamine 5'-phosphate oxidase family protein [Methanotrichaceae archaeon]